MTGQKMPASPAKATKASVATKQILDHAAMPEPIEVISGVESQLRELESRCHTLRESFFALNRQLWPVSDLLSPAQEYNVYVGHDVKSEAASGAPYENRMRDVNNEMLALEQCLDDLRMRLRV
jgi:hypothetical protein